MRITLIFAFALTMTAQQQRYSTKPVASDGKPMTVTRVKNAMEFTPDGIFLQNAAVDNGFAIEFGIWAKAQSDNISVRTTASNLVLSESRFGDHLAKLASKKHVTLPGRLSDHSAADRATIEHMHADDTDGDFVEQLLRRYDQEIVAFQREAQTGSDPDIRSFASEGMETLQKHRRLIEALQRKPQ